MDIGAFSELGFGLAALFILLLVVKYFIKAVTKKDNYIKKLVNNFNKTINNHMRHETKAFNNLANVIKEFTKEIKEIKAQNAKRRQVDSAN